MMPIEPCYSDLREGICRASDPPPRNLTFDNTSYLAAEVRLACLGVGRPAAFFRQSPNGLTILSFAMLLGLTAGSRGSLYPERYQAKLSVRNMRGE